MPGRAEPSASVAALLWIVLLTAASTGTTLVLACATPFAALAALAAVNMRRQDSALLVVVAWLASQVVGFGVHHYPHDPRTLAWAFGIGAAALGSAFAARAAQGQYTGRLQGVRLAAAFVAAFFAYNAVLALCALVLGGISTTLDPVNLTRQFLRNGAILVGLLGLFHGLVAWGFPAPRGKLVAT